MRVVVQTDDRLGPAMAGSALRAWELARAVTAAGHTVRIMAAAGSSPVTDAGPAPEDHVEPGWAQAVISPPWNLSPSQFTASSLLIIDGVTPLLAELSVLPGTRQVLRRRRTAAARVPFASACADVILVASEAQANWWRTRIDRPVTILKLPFGVSEQPTPERCEVPEVASERQLVLWWGGVWPWLDLDTLLAAIRLLNDPAMSLVVPTAPRPGGNTASLTSAALDESRVRHGLDESQVIGLSSWIPYTDRHRLLNRAAVLAVLHHPGREAELSFRTRALDGVWANIPLLLSEGGEVARLTRKNNWGEVVPVHNPETTAAALERLLDPARQNLHREALAGTVDAWRWPALARPLVDWLAAPQRIERSSQTRAFIRAAARLIRPQLEIHPS
ncbi:MAG: glycosyltransferase family 4 protein [bacterium]|nr:glycosyltransferase family 4 protein [bacterium]